jgi:hypothetical protein
MKPADRQLVTAMGFLFEVKNILHDIIVEVLPFFSLMFVAHVQVGLFPLMSIDDI